MERHLKARSASSPCSFEALLEACLLDGLKHLIAMDLRVGLQLAWKFWKNITCMPALWRKKYEVGISMDDFANHMEDQYLERMYVRLIA